VHETNGIIEKELNELKAIDKRQKERYRELEDVDCKEMLKKADVQIKVMN